MTATVLAQAGHTPPAAAGRDVALAGAQAPLRVYAFPDGAALQGPTPGRRPPTGAGD